MCDSGCSGQDMVPFYLWEGGGFTKGTPGHACIEPLFYEERNTRTLTPKEIPGL
jgi:hypothetical protein